MNGSRGSHYTAELRRLTQRAVEAERLVKQYQDEAAEQEKRWRASHEYARISEYRERAHSAERKLQEFFNAPPVMMSFNGKLVPVNSTGMREVIDACAAAAPNACHRTAEGGYVCADTFHSEVFEALLTEWVDAVDENRLFLMTLNTPIEEYTDEQLDTIQKMSQQIDSLYDRVRIALR